MSEYDCSSNMKRLSAFAHLPARAVCVRVFPRLGGEWGVASFEDVHV